MGKLSSLLWGAAIGAGAMYFWDPQNGKRRKAMVRDRFMQMRSQADDAIETSVTDLRNRVKGVLANAVTMVSDEPADDAVLEQRIRSRMGMLARHTGAVQVSVQDGSAVISGDVLANEADALIKGIQKMRGVQRVDNRLKTHQDAGNIQQLQGEGWKPGQDGMSQQSPSTRLLMGLGGSYLVVYGMGRGGIIGLLARLSGLAVGARALTNMNMRQMTGAAREGSEIQVPKSIQIHAPVEDVYRLWSNFENFSQFMSNIDAIRNQGVGRSHWVVKGPVGSKVEFDAIETDNVPNEVIAWETTPDSQVKHQGRVRFRESGRDSTQVTVNMSYMPPAGIAGAAVAALFGKDPKTEMDADLARMKSLLEKGKTTSEGKKITREKVMPVTGGDVSGGQQKERGGSRSSRRDEESRTVDEPVDFDLASDDDSELEGPDGPMTPPGL